MAVTIDSINYDFLLLVFVIFWMPLVAKMRKEMIISDHLQHEHKWHPLIIGFEGDIVRPRLISSKFSMIQMQFKTSPHAKHHKLLLWLNSVILVPHSITFHRGVSFAHFENKEQLIWQTLDCRRPPPVPPHSRRWRPLQAAWGGWTSTWLNFPFKNILESTHMI